MLHARQLLHTAGDSQSQRATGAFDAVSHSLYQFIYMHGVPVYSNAVLTGDSTSSSSGTSETCIVYGHMGGRNQLQTADVTYIYPLAAALWQQSWVHPSSLLGSQQAWHAHSVMCDLPCKQLAGYPQRIKHVIGQKIKSST